MSPGPEGKPHPIASGKKGDLPFLQGAVQDARTVVEKTRETIAESHEAMEAADEAGHVPSETSLENATRVVRSASKNAKTKSEIAHTDRAMAQVDRNEAGDAKHLGAGEAMAATPHQGLANSRTPSADADKRSADTARYEKLAREHGAGLSEEKFNEGLTKVGRRES